MITSSSSLSAAIVLSHLRRTLSSRSIFWSADGFSVSEAGFDELNMDDLRNPLGPVETCLRESCIGKHNVQ